ncbi:MAG: hypothetical protein KIS92_17130 [Planctomycetota bacterium]|nr:hypothetical protein [Planctomycetota bacterium]
MTQATAIYEYTMFGKTFPLPRREFEKAPPTDAEWRAHAEARVDKFLARSPEAAPHRAAVLAYALKFYA